jgi:hypothetical protein
MKFGNLEVPLLYPNCYEALVGSNLKVTVRLEAANFMGSEVDLWSATASIGDTPVVSGEGPTGQDALNDLRRQVLALQPLLDV